MKVPLLDLKAQYRSIRGEIETAVGEVFESQYFILGPSVTACEEAVAEYCGCEYGIGVSSGTDALLVALMAAEIGSGDEVITTPYSFFATAGSVFRTGAKPVFVDIDPVTFNIDPSQVEERITDRTRAVMPVHLYGQVADMSAILAICKRTGIPVIEDAAQAIGAERQGQRAGSFGVCGCFSFFPSKNLGGAGDGGMVTTRDEGFADKVRSLRNHGMAPKYYHQMVGGNFRLDALQAVVVHTKLKHLDAWTAQRQANAERYDRLFEQKGLSPEIITTPAHPGAEDKALRHIFNQYVIRTSRRDELVSYLHSHDIGCEIYYPVPLHMQECFASLGYREGDCPESERAARETLALPIYPELTDDQAVCVVDTIDSFYKGGSTA